MPSPAPLPPLARLRDMLSYDSETGALIWRARGRASGRGRHKIIGGSALIAHPSGYARVFLDGRNYLAHRIAFALANGREPLGQIDHRDGNPSNNAAANLREATPEQNAANKTGWGRYAKGVSLLPGRRSKPFQAAIRVGTRRIQIGTYATVAEAAEAYAAAALRHCGEFACARHAPRGTEAA